ncbi:hypothetical protein FBALC1_07213 [Flavobacteriales bacterium ALC-1]|nr:hypothetical protein FBALC1_07213 [Flavobacteriales bacterium ALC-1]
MKIAVLILAAGSSTRMGTPKQILPVGNTTLLGTTIETALQTKADKIYCVLGANAKTVEKSISKYKIKTISNSKYKSGLSFSIKAGIKHITNKSYDAVLILLGDQPFINTPYLNDMITTFKNDSTKITASNYNESPGVPAIIPKLYFNQLLELQGDKGAKSFLNSNKTNTILLKTTNLIDIDTEEDYLNYLKSL